MALGWETGHCKDQAMIRSLDLQHYALSSREGKRAGNGVNDWTYIYDESSIIIPQTWCPENFWADEHREVLGEGRTRREHGSPTAIPTYFALSVSFVISFYNKPVI